MIPGARQPDDVATSGDATNAPGQPAQAALLGGRYRLRHRIAGGGMGEVWAALDEVLGRSVAVKILRRELSEDPTFRERFRAEARHAASLSHRGIAAIYDYDDGTADMQAAPFLVMELVPGEPLSKIISDQGALSPAQTLDVIGQAARALQAAHDGGVIHRDVKPGNLLVTPDGTVKITDFGISRATNSVPLTLTGAIMGTAYYISPEQASGGSVTPASDIYSLGIVAYECLTGRRPFDGDTPVSVALAQVREHAPALPHDIPAPVHDLVMQMLAKDPAQRPPNAAAVADRAHVVAADPRAGASFDQRAATAVLPSPLETARLPSSPDTGDRRNRPTDTDPGLVLPEAPPRVTSRYVFWGVAALVLVLVALGFVFRGDEPEPRDDPVATSTPQASVVSDPLIQLDASSYLDRPADEVRAELIDLGLRVDLDDVEAAGTPGTVRSVSPTGGVRPGALITVTVVRASEGQSDDDKKDDDKDKDEEKKDDEKEKDGKGKD